MKEIDLAWENLPMLRKIWDHEPYAHFKMAFVLDISERTYQESWRNHREYLLKRFGLFYDHGVRFAFVSRPMTYVTGERPKGFQSNGPWCVAYADSDDWLLIDKLIIDPEEEKSVASFLRLTVTR